MQRRDFIKNSSLIAFSVSAFGFTKWDGKAYVGNTPTTTDILGPFYRPGAPMRSNIIPSGSTGIPLNFNGIIYKEDGVTPLPDAFVEIWQCDEKEYYDNISDDFLFRGAVKTEKDGQYNFKTIVPVPYKANPNNENSWRPAHIHMRVSSDQQQDLITQIYINGDKYNESDYSASSPDAVNRILSITKNSSDENDLKFDVVMAKNFPLSEDVYKKITGLYRIEKNIFEFVKSDDLLLAKINGQYQASLKYVGDNTFVGAMGIITVQFELLSGGDVKVTTTSKGKPAVTGTKFLKY